MDDKPPRRSRRPQTKRSKASTFPLIPFLIGVIVLGFVIGAGFSMLGRHGGSASDVADVASAAPTQTPSFAPATLAPLATPRPIPSTTDDTTADATDDASDAPDSAAPETAAPSSPTPIAVASHAASPKPSVSHTAARPKPTAAPYKASLIPSPVTPVPLPAHTHAPVAKSPAAAPVATAEPTQATVAVAHPPAAATAATTTTVDADSDFGKLSANVVRQYLRALARGDTDSAFGAFGVSPGSGGVAFPEQSVMQSSAQILSIQSRGNNDTQYVTVDIGSPNGTYYATYGVHHTQSGAAIIATHSISKQ